MFLGRMHATFLQLHPRQVLVLEGLPHVLPCRTAYARDSIVVLFKSVLGTCIPCSLHHHAQRINMQVKGALYLHGEDNTLLCRRCAWSGCPGISRHITSLPTPATRDGSMSRGVLQQGFKEFDAVSQGRWDDVPNGTGRIWRLRLTGIGAASQLVVFRCGHGIPNCVCLEVCVSDPAADGRSGLKILSGP